MNDSVAMQSRARPSGGADLVTSESPGALAQELGTIVALWRRDMLHLKKERSRWLGVVLQPVILWVILGSGLAASFTAPGGGEVDYLKYFFPGVLLMILLFTTVFATISVIEDRRSGYLQGVLVGPATRFAVVLGKIAGVTTLALVQTALFLVLAPFAGYDLAGVSWGLLIAVTILACVGLGAANLCVAWLLPSVQGYHAVMSVVMIPLWIVSGAVFPPGDTWLGLVAAANPMFYMVEGVRIALGDAATASLSLGPTLAVLGGFAAAALSLAAFLTRRR